MLFFLFFSCLGCLFSVWILNSLIHTHGPCQASLVNIFSQFVAGSFISLTFFFKEDVAFDFDESQFILVAVLCPGWHVHILSENLCLGQSHSCSKCYFLDVLYFCIWVTFWVLREVWARLCFLRFSSVLLCLLPSLFIHPNTWLLLSYEQLNV